MEWLIIPLGMAIVIVVVWLKDGQRRPYTWSCEEHGLNIGSEDLETMEQRRRDHLENKHMGGFGDSE